VEENITLKENIIYEIEQVDIVLAYNCLCYFTDKNATKLLSLLYELNGKDLQKRDNDFYDDDLNIEKSHNIEKSYIYNLENLGSKSIELNQLKFLFFITILTKIHLNNGSTYIYLPDFNNKILSFKLNKLTKFFEKFLILLSDLENNVSIDNQDEEKGDKNKEGVLFSYKFGDFNSTIALIEKINKRKRIFDIKNTFENIFNDLGYNNANNDIEEEEDKRNERIIKNPPLFIFETKSKLYFRRFYLYEQLIAKDIFYRLENRQEESKKLVKLQNFIDIFKNTIDEKQLKAVKSALVNDLTVISGGPGTGKTYILSLIILAYIMIYGYKPNEIIAVAPTGKATKRISESLHDNINRFIKLIKVRNNDLVNKEINEAILIEEDDIKIESITIHRLLKGSEVSLSFLHNRENKVEYSVVIVDEASMIDISLMAKLLDALKKDAKLILIGDANQLSSVEAGKVFFDLKEFLIEKNEKYNSCIVELTKSYRYKENSVVELAKELLNKVLNSKDEQEKFKLSEEFIKVLKEKERLIESPIDNELFENLRNKITEFNLSTTNNEIKEQFELLKKFKFLSPLRLSKHGTYNINNMYVRYLKRIDRTKFIPIIITKNNYQLRLFNGDIGIIVEKDDDIYAYFESEESDLPLKEFPLSSLSNWEIACCLTVHKSQGSEFDTVVLFLPENVTNFEFITVELLYTAITRAKEDFYIVSNKESLKQVILKKSKRFTGLYDKLHSFYF